MKLIAATDSHMTRPKISIPSKSSSWYPSEASVEWYDSVGERRIEGTCQRAAFFRYTGKFAHLEFRNSAYTEWIFALGKAVEEILLKQYKEMGIWVDNNKKFFDEKRNISGEIDFLLRDPENGELFGVECCTPSSLIVNSDYRLLPFSETNSVITHNGQVASIVNFQKRQVENQPVYTLRSKIDGLEAQFTGNHPILIARIKESRLKKNNKKRTRQFLGTEWKKAENVKRGDYLCFPKAKFGSESFTDLSESTKTFKTLMNESNWKYQIINNRIYSMSHNCLQQEVGFPEEITNLNDFYWLLGLYVAEGSCSKNVVYFSLHEDELEIISRVKSILSSWGLNTSVKSLVDSRTKMKSKGVNLAIYSKPFRELVKAIVPGNSIQKTKHVIYKQLNKKYLQSFLLGIWQGDGCYCRKNNTDSPLRISTVVPHLAYLYWQVAATLGFSPILKKHKQMSNYNSDFIYYVSWSGQKFRNKTEKLIDCGDFWSYKVKKVIIRKYTGPVLNLECIPEHTYTVGGIATHNCKSMAGYNAKKGVMGNRTQRPAPKAAHLLQTLIYIDQFKSHLSLFKMVYYSRDSADRKEFDITLVHNSDGKTLPAIDGIIDHRFTLEDIYDRYLKLQQYVDAGKVPPPDFEKIWDEEKVLRRQQMGEVGKTDFAAWKKSPKKNPIGDWECSYCKYLSVCNTV